MRARQLFRGPIVPVLLILAASACSSAPPKTDTVTDVKNQANDAEVSGQHYYSQGRYDLALQFFRQALDQNASVDNMDGVIRSRIAIGQVYLATDQLPAAEDVLTGARAQAKARGSMALFIDSSISLGELHLRKNEPQKALGILQEVLDTPQAKMTPQQTGVLYHDMGAAWKGSGDLGKALDWLSRSLQNNLTSKLLESAAADYYMIASVHSKQGDFAGATSNAEQALALDKKIENSPGIAMDLYALGLINTRSGDTAAAYDYYQRAYTVFTTLGEKNGMRKTLTELISVARSLGRAEEAQSYQQALAGLGAP